MDTTPRSRQKPTSAGLFQCSACQRAFTRVDHLTRHVRSHLRERPFHCSICSKAFGRRDLLKRHEASHNADADGAEGRRSRRHKVLVPRVSQACKNCAAAKLKCDDQKPCGRCLQKGLFCQPEGRDVANSVPSEGASHSSSPVASQTGSTSHDVPADLDTIMVQTDAPCHAEPLSAASTTVHHGPHPPPPPDFATGPLNFGGPGMSGFPRGIMTPTAPASFQPYYPLPAWPDLNLGQDGPGALLDFSTEANLDFDEADFGFIDQLCGDPHLIDAFPNSMPAPSQYSPPAQAVNPQPSPPSPLTATTGNGAHRGHVAEAFKRSSLGLWTPEPKDRAGAEVEDFSVLGDGTDLSSEVTLTPGNCLAGEKLGRNARDEFLAMILNSCRLEPGTFAIKAFPTAEALDVLIQNFFSHHCLQIDSFIHGPSFSSNQHKTLLLAAIVASGAILTNLKSVHKLGFAIQEAVRTTIPVMCEESNATTRELWMLQSFLCEIEIGLWSGIKRKMEIAESQPQIVYTMLRRSRRFSKMERIPPPLAQDTGEALHRKWLAWVELESFKRLVYHAFVMDAQTSMAMLTSPLISFAELKIPLPESRDLWLAQDAEHWKAVYLNRPRASQPPELSVTDLVQEPVEVPDHYDLDFTRLIILCATWGLIWHRSQLLLMTKRPGHGQATGTDLRYNDLLQTLQHFRMHLAERTTSPGAETILILELLPMHLHVSLSDIQLLAGKQDPEDARYVLPSLQQWAESRESRQAIWHAGQVLRAAKTFQHKQPRGFYTIALFHAGLVLWAYGVISRAKGDDHAAMAHSTTDEAQRVVSLDGDDSPAVQRFITLGKGVPCVSRQSAGMPVVLDPAQAVPLTDTEGVMGVFVDALGRNFPCNSQAAGEAAPPLVENLIQLLRELGKAVGV